MNKSIVFSMAAFLLTGCNSEGNDKVSNQNAPAVPEIKMSDMACLDLEQKIRKVHTYRARIDNNIKISSSIGGTPIDISKDELYNTDVKSLEKTYSEQCKNLVAR